MTVIETVFTALSRVLGRGPSPPMGFNQSIEGCLEGAIGANGLSSSSLHNLLDRLDPHLDELRASYSTGSLPILTIPGEKTDIDAAAEALAALISGARTLVFFGTGGSSLGGQTFAQLGGWNIPGERPKGQDQRPRTRFYDNLDPKTLDQALNSLDLETTRFIVISKSGNTAETLVQTIAALSAVKKAGLEARIPEIFLGLTEPPKEGVKNGLRQILSVYGVPMLEHHTEIGGRYSCLTNVGLLPALARGMDVHAARAGAKRVVDEMLSGASASEFPPALGAAVAIGLAKENNIRASVMMPYSDRLGRFASWYAQLWAESLGKGSEGTTPIVALGPVDQHSQLQLYMDGPQDHMFTILRTKLAGTGSEVDKDLADLSGLDYMAGKHAGDLVEAQQHAIAKALLQAKRPVRTIDMDRLDESVMGGLMMHFMLETILAARLIGVNPFDQPAVETGKKLARQLLNSEH